MTASPFMQCCFRWLQQYNIIKDTSVKLIKSKRSYSVSASATMPRVEKGKDDHDDGEKKNGSFQGSQTEQIQILIVGLGNDGFPDTRHSIGMRAVDQLATRLGADWQRSNQQFSGYLAHAVFRTDGNKIKLVLLKPKTMMNINGGVVAKAAKTLSIESKNIILVHDDLDKSLGKFQFKEGGSAGGHHGVLSCMDSLRSNAMLRLKIGISRPSSKLLVIPYVLGRFSQEELATVDRAINQSIEALLQHFERRVSAGVGVSVPFSVEEGRRELRRNGDVESTDTRNGRNTVSGDNTFSIKEGTGDHLRRKRSKRNCEYTSSETTNARDRMSKNDFADPSLDIVETASSEPSTQSSHTAGCIASVSNEHYHSEAENISADSCRTTGMLSKDAGKSAFRKASNTMQDCTDDDRIDR